VVDGGGGLGFVAVNSSKKTHNQHPRDSYTLVVIIIIIIILYSGYLY
jgi:ABC-type methionine transport system permease subunit